MADEERIQLPPVLESVLRYCLKDAQERMEKGEQLVPFTALAVKDKLFMEEHGFDTPEECFADARKTVEHARGAQAYGLCYDGYVDLATGRADALIAQGSVPGDEYGHAIGILYRTEDGSAPKFHEEPIYIGTCLNYMSGLEAEFEDSEGDAGQARSSDGSGESTE